jgi:hypothetical protein
MEQRTNNEIRIADLSNLILRHPNLIHPHLEACSPQQSHILRALSRLFLPLLM